LCYGSLDGIRPLRIPVLREAFGPSELSLASFPYEALTVRSDDEAWAGPLERIARDACLHMRPHFGWTGHIELEEVLRKGRLPDQHHSRESRELLARAGDLRSAARTLQTLSLDIWGLANRRRMSRIHDVIDLVRPTETWTPDEQRRYVANQLREVLRHTLVTVPRYGSLRHLIAELTAELQDLEDILQEFPIVSREEIAADPQAFRSSEPSVLARQVMTSGTTGSPLTVWLDHLTLTVGDAWAGGERCGPAMSRGLGGSPGGRSRGPTVAAAPSSTVPPDKDRPPALSVRLSSRPRHRDHDDPGARPIEACVSHGLPLGA